MLLHSVAELIIVASACRAMVAPWAEAFTMQPSLLLPLQGRGGSTGYDNAVALPARSDSDELAKENTKSTVALKGQAVFSVAKIDTETNEIAGELDSVSGAPLAAQVAGAELYVLLRLQLVCLLIAGGGEQCALACGLQQVPALRILTCGLSFAGVFESIQPSDTDLGSKAPKDIKITGLWYGQLN